MIDDMQGLYSHASDAFRAGQRSGRDEFFRAANGALGSISAKHERGPAHGVDGQLVTARFHVAEECCKAVRDVRDALDKPRSERIA